MALSRRALSLPVCFFLVLLRLPLRNEKSEKCVPLFLASCSFFWFFWWISGTNHQAGKQARILIPLALLAHSVAHACAKAVGVFFC